MHLYFLYKSNFAISIYNYAEYMSRLACILKTRLLLLILVILVIQSSIGIFYLF